MSTKFNCINILTVSLFLLHTVICVGQNQLRVDSLKSVLVEQINNFNDNQHSDLDYIIQNTNTLNTLDPTEAIFYMRQLKEKGGKHFTAKQKGKVILTTGNYYWGVGIYNIALNNYFEALSIFEKSNDTIQLVRVLNNIGETYKKQHKYTLAKQFLSLALKNQPQNDSSFPLIKVNIAQLLILTQELDSASKILAKIIEQYNPENNKLAIGYAYLYKGLIHKNKNQFDSAKYYINKAAGIWEQLYLRRNLSESFTELVDIYLIERDLENAKHTLSIAQRMAQSTHALDILLRIYSLQIELIELNRSDDSLGFYYKKYLVLKDSLYNEASRKEVNKLTVQYNLSEKEKEYYKLALEQETLKNQYQNQRAMLAVFGIVLCLLVASFYLQYRKRKQLAIAHQHLTDQKIEIEQKQQELSKKSLELANLNQELYQLNRGLERKVIDRSEQLNIKNQQIAEYTFYNSHKLRAPVASILGLINVMELNRDGKVDESLLVHLKSCALELDVVIHRLKVLLDSEFIEKIENRD